MPGTRSAERSEGFMSRHSTGPKLPISRHATRLGPVSTPPYQQQWLDRGADRLGLQWYPEPARPAGTLALLWPAMGVPAGYYRPFATALGRAGVAVVVAHLRGTGASTPRPSRRSRYGYADLVDDVAAGVA